MLKIFELNFFHPRGGSIEIHNKEPYFSFFQILFSENYIIFKNAF